MGNIIDYLKRAHGLSFQEHPFNEVDNLILSQISYLDFDGIIDKPIPLRDAFTKMMRRDPQHNRTNGLGSESLMTFALFELMAKSRRFGSAVLSHYACKTNEHLHEQFAALSVSLSNRFTYVAFRGTDDSLVGWREDFEMSYRVVHAQASAVAYLNSVARDIDGPLLVGGHSKGGNLAVFAGAMCCDAARRQVQVVYCNDGPGFCADVIPDKRLDEVESIVQRFVPYYCIVGALMGRRKAKVVASSGKGIMQHSAFTWQVEGSCFKREDAVAPGSVGYSNVLDDVIRRYPKEKRQVVVDSLFNLFEQMGCSKVSDIASVRSNQAVSSLKALANLDIDVQEAVEGLFAPLIGEGLSQAFNPMHHAVAGFFKLNGKAAILGDTPGKAKSPSRRLSVARMASWFRKRTLVRSGVLIGLGTLAVANAKAAIPPILYAASFSVIGYGLYLLARFFAAKRHGTPRVQDCTFGLLAVLFGALVLVFHSLFEASSNVLFGGGLLVYGMNLLKRQVSGLRRKKATAVLKSLAAVAAVVIGVMLLAHPFNSSPVAVIVAGAFMIAKGVYDYVVPGEER